MLFSYVPFGVTVMVLGCPDYLHWVAIGTEWEVGSPVVNKRLCMFCQPQFPLVGRGSKGGVAGMALC